MLCSSRLSNLSVLAGVISREEKTVYRCDDPPDDGEQVGRKFKFKPIEEAFERTARCVNLFHGVRSE